MSDPHPPLGNVSQTATSGFLFHDWGLPEKGTAEKALQFDGKIIARMPDIGSESLTDNIKVSKFSVFWEKLGASIASMIQGQPATRQRFLRNCVAVGSIVLLCGIGFLVLERERTPTDNVLGIAEIVLPSTEPPMIESVAIIGDSGKFTPIMLPDGIITPPTIPGASMEGIATMPPPVGDSTYSPWDVAARQPENPPERPIAEALTLTGAPYVPPPSYDTVAMAPMIDMSIPMPISPYERQQPPQPNMPIDPFAQTHTGIVPGMIPVHERQENALGVATTQNVQRPIAPPLYPQYAPPSAVQDMYGQHGQYNPHVVPPNTPIPSGVSTLSPQGGYATQYYPSGAPLPVPRQPSDFYAPPSSSYRRVY